MVRLAHRVRVAGDPCTLRWQVPETKAGTTGNSTQSHAYLHIVAAVGTGNRSSPAMQMTGRNGAMAKGHVVAVHRYVARRRTCQPA